MNCSIPFSTFWKLFDRVDVNPSLDVWQNPSVQWSGPRDFILGSVLIMYLISLLLKWLFKWSIWYWGFMVNSIFGGSGPFHLSCQIYVYRPVCSVLYYPFDFCRVCSDTLFFIPDTGNFLFSLFDCQSYKRCFNFIDYFKELSLCSIDSLDFHVFPFVFILALALNLFYFSFSKLFRCELRLQIWYLPLFPIYAINSPLNVTLAEI